MDQNPNGWSCPLGCNLHNAYWATIMDHFKNPPHNFSDQQIQFTYCMQMVRTRDLQAAVQDAQPQSQAGGNAVNHSTSPDDIAVGQPQTVELPAKERMASYEVFGVKRNSNTQPRLVLKVPYNPNDAIAAILQNPSRAAATGGRSNQTRSQGGAPILRRSERQRQSREDQQPQADQTGPGVLSDEVRDAANILLAMSGSSNSGFDQDETESEP